MSKFRLIETLNGGLYECDDCGMFIVYSREKDKLKLHAKKHDGAVEIYAIAKVENAADIK